MARGKKNIQDIVNKQKSENFNLSSTSTEWSSVTPLRRSSKRLSKCLTPKRTTVVKVDISEPFIHDILSTVKPQTEYLEEKIEKEMKVTESQDPRMRCDNCSKEFEKLIRVEEIFSRITLSRNVTPIYNLSSSSVICDQCRALIRNFLKTKYKRNPKVQLDSANKKLLEFSIKSQNCLVERNRLLHSDLSRIRSEEQERFKSQLGKLQEEKNTKTASMESKISDLEANYRKKLEGFKTDIGKLRGTLMETERKLAKKDRELSEKVLEYEDFIKTLKDESEKKIESLESEVTEKDKLINEKVSRLRELESFVEKYKSENEELKSSVSEKETKISEFSKNLSDKTKLIEERDKEITSLSERLSRQTTLVESLKKVISDVEFTIAEKEKKLSAEIEKFKSKESLMSEELVNSKSRIKSLEEELSTFKEKLKQSAELNGKLIKDKDKELEKLKSLIKQIKTEFTIAIEEARQKAKVSQSENANLKKRLSRKDQIVTEFKEKLEGTQEEVRELQTTVKVLKKLGPPSPLMTLVGEPDCDPNSTPSPHGVSPPRISPPPLIYPVYETKTFLDLSQGDKKSFRGIFEGMVDAIRDPGGQELNKEALREIYEVLHNNVIQIPNHFSDRPKLITFILNHAFKEVFNHLPEGVADDEDGNHKSKSTQNQSHWTADVSHQQEQQPRPQQHQLPQVQQAQQNQQGNDKPASEQQQKPPPPPLILVPQVQRPINNVPQGGPIPQQREQQIQQRALEILRNLRPLIPQAINNPQQQQQHQHHHQQQQHMTQQPPGPMNVFQRLQGLHLRPQLQSYPVQQPLYRMVGQFNQFNIIHSSIDDRSINSSSSNRIFINNNSIAVRFPNSSSSSYAEMRYRYVIQPPQNPQY